MEEKNKIDCTCCLDKGYIDKSDVERLNKEVKVGYCEFCIKGIMQSKLSAIRKAEEDNRYKLEVKKEQKIVAYLLVSYAFSLKFLGTFSYILIVFFLYTIALILGKQIPQMPLEFEPFWLINITITSGFIIVWWIRSIVILIKSWWKELNFLEELFQNSILKLKYLGYCLFSSSLIFISNKFFQDNYTSPLTPDNIITEFVKMYENKLELGDLLFVFIPFIFGLYFVLKSLYNKKYNFED